LSFKTTILTQPKTISFWPLFFYFLLKKEEEEEEEEEERKMKIGGSWSHPLGQNGVV
jgi:hypothetical protein